MNSSIDKEKLQNYNQAEAFISLFFAGLDLITYIVILTLFGFEFKSLNSPKQKLTMFLLLDGISRIIHTYTNSYNQLFVRETLFSSIVALQFYLSISMLEQIFTYESNESSLLNELKIKNKYLFSFLFFWMVFSFKGLVINNFLSPMQYICTLILITIFYKYIGNKINLFLANIWKKNIQFQGKNVIGNLPFLIFLYFSIFYILQLCGLIIHNELYESYMTMICTIFKESAKYLNILFLIGIYHLFNKYIIKSNFVNENKHTQNKIKVHVYKDEEDEEIS